MNRSHHAARVRRISKDRIAQETLLVREQGSGTRISLELFLGDMPGRLDNLGMEFGSNKTIKQAVMAGLGLGFISAHTIVMEVELGRLMILDVVDTPVRRQWFLVSRTARTDSPTMTAFREFVIRRGRDFCRDLCRRASPVQNMAMSSIRFRTIGFDLDGTIADTAPDLMAALNHTLQSVGRNPLPLDRVRRMIGHGTRALLRNGLAATGTADEAEVAAGYPLLMDYYERHVCDFTRPYPNVEAALDALAAQGIKLAVCTNKPERVSRLLIGALGWTYRFAAIVGGDTRAVSKPDPDPLHFAIEQAGGGPAAFIGDSITDVQTAKAAGLPCVVVSFGFADRPADQLGADRVIDDFAELVPALALL